MVKDIDGAGRVGPWWLAWEIALVAVVAAVAIPFGAAGSGVVPGELAALTAAAIEKVSPAEHHAHGHTVAATDRVICGVHVFGFEPSTATKLADVHTVYGYYFCAVGAPGLTYDASARADGPVVVQLGPTPVVRIVPAGAGYQERVRAIMPDEYEAACFAGLPDPAVATAVRARYESTP